jgi:hypothetical protein
MLAKIAVSISVSAKASSTIASRLSGISEKAPSWAALYVGPIWMIQSNGQTTAIIPIVPDRLSISGAGISVPYRRREELDEAPCGSLAGSSDCGR